MDEKVILITGSSGGIGSVLSEKFADKGFKVIMNFNKSELAAKSIMNKINEKHGQNSAICIKADVSKRNEVKSMYDKIYQIYNRLDILINNAGLNIDRPFLELTDDDWSIVQNTILTGTFICSQEFALTYKGGNGHILNIGALTAIRGRKNGANYCSARAGVINLTKCIAQELAPKIRVNCITPGWINSEEVMHRYQLYDPKNLERTLPAIPLHRLGTPEDVFRLAFFLVDESTYITGQNYLIDGGMLMY